MSVLLQITAFLGGYNTKLCWKTFRSGSGKHESPKAGFAEAAMAGALEIQLGGPGTYFGKKLLKPHIGILKKSIAIEDI